VRGLEISTTDSVERRRKRSWAHFVCHNCVSRCKAASTSQRPQQKRIKKKSQQLHSLLRSNDLAGHELRVGVGEVGHVAHDGIHGGLVLGGLLEVRHAAPLEGGLDAVRSVVAELEDLWRVSE
jgi:hypothetical protein